VNAPPGDPPRGLITPHEQGRGPGDAEDRRARALLEDNGYGTDTEALRQTLQSGVGILQAAAARLLGVGGSRVARDDLLRLARDPAAEETARVQAAVALARLDDEDAAREVLTSILRLPLEASPGPLQAAGALAELGDPQGFPVVEAGLRSDNRVIAMIACKQLPAFVPFDGRDGVDVYRAFAAALSHPEDNVATEARSQLEALGTERAQNLLQRA
jgi:hypothetical protein